MAVKCGRCSNYHPDVTGVRHCFNGGVVEVVDIPRQPTSHRDMRPTEKQWKFLNDLIEQTGKPRLSDERREHFTRHSISEAINDAKLDVDQAKRDGTLAMPPAAQPKSRHLQASDYPQVQDGRYALRSITGSNDLDFFKVDVPVKGNWQGCLFVKRILGGGANGENRTERVSRKTAERWLSYLASPEAVLTSMAMYGSAVGHCGKCGRELTDELSRSRGIGPDCYSRYF